MTQPPLPLEGIRVLELTTAWAGPFCGRLLGDLGAEVIKIESRRRLDVRGPVRPPVGVNLYPDNDPGEDPWNRSHRFHERNRNKLSVAMELNQPQGRDAFLRLVGASDVIVENFSPRVLPQFGLGYGSLTAVKPDLVMVSLSGFGQTGPERDNVAFGPTVEQVSGLASLLGYADGPPSATGLFLPDVLGGTLAAGLVMSALRSRALNGGGTYIDLAEIEVIRWMTGHLLLGAQAGRPEVSARLGNRHPEFAPHGVFPCVGEDRWIAIAVETDEQWVALAGVLGRHDLAESYPRREDRADAVDAVEAEIFSWTSDLEQDEAVARLRSAGVPTSAVATADQVLASEHVAARDVFTRYPGEGSSTRAMSGGLWMMDGWRPGVRAPAPNLGEHNDYVLGTIAGFTEDEIVALRQAGVVGELPSELEA